MKYLVEPLVMTLVIGALWIFFDVIENEPILSGDFFRGIAYVVLAQAALLAYRMVRKKRSQQPRDE